MIHGTLIRAVQFALTGLLCAIAASAFAQDKPPHAVSYFVGYEILVTPISPLNAKGAKS